MKLNPGDGFREEFIVNESVYQSFIKTFSDRNPLHTDEKYAKEHGFRSIVMHGNILGGFLSYFVGERLPIKNIIIHKQEMKFYNPVYLNDKLFLEAKVDEVFESVNAIEIKFKFSKDNQKVAAGTIQIGII
jgi:3-hydroxybutyryl-CoA dehydratase